MANQKAEGRPYAWTVYVVRGRRSETNIYAYIGCPGPIEKYSKKDGNRRWERDIPETAKNDRDSSQRNIKVSDRWLT